MLSLEAGRYRHLTDAQQYHLRQYEKPYESTVALSRFIQSVTGGPLRGEVNDVGCGAGSAIFWFDQWGLTAAADVLGIDASRTLIDKGHERNPDRRFLVADFLDPLPACDVSLSIQVLSFIEDWRPALREILSSTNQWLFASSLFWTGVDTHTHASDSEKNNAHYNIISREEFELACRRAGWQVARWLPFYAQQALYAPHAQLRSRTYEAMTFSGPLYLPWTFVAVRKT